MLEKIKVGLGSTTNVPDEKKYIGFLKDVISRGIINIDTAEAYGKGNSEKLIGKAIKNIDRKKVFITTKVWESNLRYEDVISSLKGSLKRLNLDYIDLYLIHKPNPDIPLKETIEAMDFLVKMGYIKHIGVSNFSLKLLKKAQSYTKNKIVANSVEYNLLRRRPEGKLLDYCQKNEIVLIAWNPLLSGRLAKKGFKMLDEMAKKYNKTQAQISINWLVSKKNVIAIPRTLDLVHFKENIGSSGWNLSDEDYQKLDRHFKRFWIFDYVKSRIIFTIKMRLKWMRGLICKSPM